MVNRFFNLLPKRSDYSNFAKDWKHDLLAGVTVGIVALPLALAFAITTGVSPTAGVVTAIVAGMVTAIFGGSVLQVSGPTGAMTVVLVPIVATYGSKALLPVGLLAAGLMIFLSLLGIATWINHTPWSVMEGFTLGIAIVIALQQLPMLLNVKKAAGTQTLIVAYRTISHAISSGLHYQSLLIALATLAIKFSTPKFLHHFKIKIFIPGSFTSIAVMTLIMLPFNVAKVGTLPRNIFHPVHEIFSLQGLTWTALVTAAVSVLFLGSLESLLSAKIADQMSHHLEFPKLNPNRELFGQGIGNLFSLVLGGIPSTGAIARTSVNFRSGAKSRFAAVVHSIFLLAVVFVLGPVISQVPMAALAAVLVGTSYRVANPTNLRELLRTSTKEQVVLIGTAAAVVFTDLVRGALIGIAIHVIWSKFQNRKVTS